MGQDAWEPAVDAANRRAMQSAAAVDQYLRADYLDPGERLLYEAVRAEADGAPLLDLGVGGGRTVPALTAISRDYLALDYTPAMVAATRSRFPALDVREGDARDLRGLRDGHFQLVVFSCAGLDMVGRDDRARILAEVARVLRPGGAFVFSTHNWEHRRAQGELPWLEPGARGVRGRLRAAARLLRHGLRWRRNRRALAALGQREAEWAVLNSPYHDFSTLMHYVTLREQRAQLERAGFSPGARAASHEGAWVEGEGTPTPMLHLLARKPAGGATRRA